MIDLKAKSEQFAELISQAQTHLRMTSEEVAKMTGINPKRLASLLRREKIFTRAEVQVLSVMLGIGLDRLFPLDIKDSEVQRLYRELRKQGIGLIAPLEGCSNTNKISQLEFERAVVRLNYCASSLAQFPIEAKYKT